MSTFWHKMSDLKPVCTIKMWKLTEKSYFCALSVTFLRRGVHFKVGRISFKAILSGKTQWRVMSTFWHKMSGRGPVMQCNMGILTEKSYFCALSVTFLRLGCILKLEGLLQAYVKWKNTMTVMSTFWHKMSDLDQFAIKMWKLTEKSYFCALSVTFLRRGCILKLEGISFKPMLSGKTQWRLMSTFWHKMSGLDLL